MSEQLDTIQLHCDCGQRLRAKPEQAGKSFPCPRCGSSLTVPWPSPPDMLPEAAETHSAMPATPQPQLSPPTIPRIPLILSGVALFVSLATSAWTLWHDPLGAGIRQYDLSTPEKSLRSFTDLRVSGSIRAQIELGRLIDGKKLQEKSKTLKVHSESNYQGKKILFVSFMENGIPKNDIEAFEKDADTGLWFPRYVPTYSMSDAAIGKAIKEWKAKTGSTESE